MFKNKINVTGKRVLTVIMSLAMMLTCIPITAFATENSEKINKNLMENLMVPDTNVVNLRIL